MGNIVSKIRFALKFLKYRLFGQTKHDVHSPFVFDLITEVIEETNPYYIFQPIEVLRSYLLISKKKLNITDFGAGSSINKAKQRTVADIAENSAKPAKYGQLMFRLINRFQPETILELGTSLGISTLYLAGSVPKAKVITLEGCPETAAVAEINFNKLKIDNIEVVVGDFKNTLSNALNLLKKTDIVFFDGNHKKDPTIEYFEKCLPYAHNDSMFIFDDIHWSDEMEQAWHYIKNHPKVTVTIDLFFIGLVFFRSEQVKQHFTIKV